MNIRDYFSVNKNIIVAFSGGVDSSVLLFLAKKYAENVIAVFVKSEFQPDFELEDAIRVSDEIGIELNIININVINNKNIISNPADRCYYCKKMIMQRICDFAVNYDGYVIADGTNASDDVNDRAGYKALQELGIHSPLRMSGITKDQIRQIAKENNISVCDKPSYACLATRVPTGTEITARILDNTQKAEQELFASGFNDFRVRYMNGNALLQLNSNDFKKIADKKDEIYNILSKYYKNVYLDLKGR